MNIIFVFLSNPYMTQPSKCAASALTLDVWMKSPGGKVLLIHCEASSLILAIGTSTSVNLCNLSWKLSKPVTRPWKTACLLGEGIAFKLHRITSMKGPVYSSALNARQLVPYVLRWGRWCCRAQITPSYRCHLAYPRACLAHKYPLRPRGAF